MDNPLVQLDPGLFIWTILTFLILFGALAKYAWKPLLKALENRENMIRSSIADAEKAQQELETINQQSDNVLAKARAESQAILVDGKVAAEKVKEDTLNQAKEKATAIIESAEKQIQVEKDKAISEIKGEVANLAIQVAEKLIQKNLNRDDNQSLIDESLQKIKGYEA
ncbi:MAG: F0F1 ATP synthase subunit B [Candidatus Marinimicrobia bacterium]|jgi:F-type H+-transporting ATPase subunit b|nr:F0F1 ATP synthase subunit B [Candidatus Neomarinimicrobiota bacterium]MBT3937992.1 F0F1 ATP synthase subunit B [Candidatus Neomarinimicrobiota bacterium]MBT3961596.1 F0F1 ATP synthase subunit B [Candidatus Neomarinimicrobiota bacterium]MBT4382016.1 F0F1 ATP synthase subunit B [Candidatus Neomarinimicrobiota bacterium]MBT4636129.1 F0F1 ATP synthase subunit B [Candidatus Neomarinimicrobiota bacterium]